MKRNMILGSGSPRRRETLKDAGFSYEILLADADESHDETQPDRVVEVLSHRKAKAVWERLSDSDKAVKLVLGADTIVSDPDGKILGKPKNEMDAKTMLNSLSGRTHSVYTGVTLIYQTDEMEEKTVTFSEKSLVKFYPMTKDEINWYVGSGECMDKAGAYAIQGLSMRFIEKLDGDYHNVVGLPAAKLYQVLKKSGIEII